MTKELLQQADEFEIPKEIIEFWERKDKQEKPLVKALGDAIGYGRLMQLTEETWREKTKFKGSEFTVGACVSFMVPCDHSIKDGNGHCELCCGAGRITKGVKALADEVRGKEWQPIETAPKDRTKILGFTPYGVETVHYNEEHSSDDISAAYAHYYKSGWWGTEQDSCCRAERHVEGSGSTPATCQPTHWQPLPQPPKED